MNYPYLFAIFLFIFSCKQTPKPTSNPPKQLEDTITIYTQPSLLTNQYQGFNSPIAINKIAEIENEYFNNFQNGHSKYYGTQWKAAAAIDNPNDSTNRFDLYCSILQKKGIQPDSMHCTIYAMKALKAGLGENFKLLDNYHKKIWGKREYAGWSVGYILTKHFGWKAYLFLSEQSHEYNYCKRNFAKDQKYHVWYQPDIPIEKVYSMETEQKEIDSLLLQNEFGWGFSDQGWHTWVTRFDTLKECNWAGTPTALDPSSSLLFLKTSFVKYKDYASHVIVFPPTK